MTRNRLAFLKRGEKLAIEKGKCRVCLVSLVGRQRGFCGHEHREAYYLATSEKYLRFRTYQRDRGVCSYCGEDCDRLEVRVFGFSTMVKLPSLKAHQHALLLPIEERKKRVAILMENGWPPLSPQPKTLWHADHREPLVDGGSFALDNVATACLRCHSIKTADEAKWRAKRRKLVGTKGIATRKHLRKMSKTRV